ncbi:TonB-dependent receptor [Chitinophaga nivalis]|uniref:TonB-dependent receptor n=1 Tax=Chitinophaga nivalis TaxID=2991709 RepID=A0ABT3ILJ3_9BACT|nr:TonB-dependent receptor [Chitinophaga nivalis]MCW3465476.1 TonB-dependent receptor [Chitinophaga nivalis]MCW3484833.1 TonB-dependent receptor [Chitinophaga nivalis]
MSFRLFGLLLIPFFCPVAAAAQYTLQGIVVDSNHHLLRDIPLLLTAENKSVPHHTITNKSGRFTFTLSARGNYLLQTTSQHYLADSVWYSFSKDTFVTITLQPAVKTLKEVAVTATQPVFEKKIDRFVFHVQNTSLVAGNNTWDVLKQTPLVNAQESGSLSILGLAGVAVYINHRRSMLSGKDLQQYLSSLPADNIQHIEVITVPSSKYEAGNPGGIIHIVLRKNETEGLNGSINLANEQATYNSQYANGGLNYRGKKYGQQLFVNGGSRRGFYHSDNDIVYTGKQQEFIYNQTVKKPENNIGISTVADYLLNSHSLIGAAADFRTSYAKDANSGYNTIRTFDDTDSGIAEYYNENPETKRTRFLSLNLNYQYTNKKNQEELGISTDYFHYNNDQAATFLSYEKKRPGTVHNGNRTSTSQRIRNYAVRADYSRLIAGNIKLETGLRFSRTQTDNELLADHYTTGTWTFNAGRSNVFRYEENIGAAYISVYKKLNSQLEVKAGGRLEQTYLKTIQLTSGQNNDRQYLNFFPTAYINYTINSRHSLSLAVKSDIRRPSYSQLNPFVYYISDKYLVKGNPELRPSNSLIAELSYTLHKDYIFLARYTKSNHLFEQVAVVIPPDTTLLDRFNYGNSTTWGLTSVISKTLIKDKWRGSISNTVSLVQQFVDVPQAQMNTSNFQYTCNISQQFTNIFNTTIDASVNGRYYSKTVSANTDISGTGEVGIGFSKKIPACNMQLSFYAGDIFNTLRLNHFYTYNTFSVSDMTAFSDTRYFRISVNKKLGSTKIKTVRKKDTSNSDEANRAR